MTSPGVVFVPTPPDVGLEMLKLAGVTSNDLVYDLGSGDGRLVIAAAQLFGARAVGVELDAKLVQDSREAAAKAGVADRVTFVWGDLFQVDLRPATAVMLYLTADMNLRLRPRLLAELRPGTPVVSHAFDMGEWIPDRSVRVFSADGARRLNLWIIPARVQGTWAISVSMPDGELSATAVLEQNFQRLTGLLRTPTDVVPIVESSLRGDVIAFSATLGMKPGPRTIRFRGWWRATVPPGPRRSPAGSPSTPDAGQRGDLRWVGPPPSARGAREAPSIEFGPTDAHPSAQVPAHGSDPG